MAHGGPFEPNPDNPVNVEAEVDAALRQEVAQLRQESEQRRQESELLKQDLGYVVRYLRETYEADPTSNRNWPHGIELRYPAP
jgi:hypothetical protein